MRRLYIIGILGLIYLACSSRSCTDEGSPQNPRYLHVIDYWQDSVISRFSMETLYDSDLRTFEDAAVQNFPDWAEYVRIAEDTAMDKAFRDQARRMAAGFFLSADEAWKMADSLFGSGWWRPGSVYVSRHLARVNDSLYAGMITCHQMQPDPMMSNNWESSVTIPFFIMRSIKAFGPDTARVWRAYLGYY